MDGLRHVTGMDGPELRRYWDWIDEVYEDLFRRMLEKRESISYDRFLEERSIKPTAKEERT